MDLKPTTTDHRRLAQLARQRFVEGLCAGLPALDNRVHEFLTELMGQTATQREMQQRRDAWMSYQAHRKAWIELVTRAWREALLPQSATAAMPLDGGLELVGDDVVENKLLASRIALTVVEHVGAPFDAARQRTQYLEGRELSGRDVLRPETLCLRLVEPWLEAGLKREDMQLVLDPLQRQLGELALAQYQALARLYDQQGVAAAEGLRALVRRPLGTGASRHGALGPDSGGATLGRETPFPATLVAQPGAMPAPKAGARPGAAGLANPLAYARQRAQGVMVQLRRLLTLPLTGGDMAQAPPASPALVHALADERVAADLYYSDMATLVEDYSPQAVVHVAQVVRERAAEFKKKAGTASEKAIIEVVALMFQSILSEDRIPPAVRVWFARLQVPVLRVALAEPEFFSDLAHPARQLIDRMGSCVLGFDASAIGGTALETEVRRIVQVIEQYPETGKRVFELVLAEFEKFLAKFLTERQSTSRIVSVAQQVEQRETLAIQYTIELRNLLKDMPVRDEIREFLFKSWAEVLAMSAVRDGPQHADTVAYKQAAVDLVWAASAKPNRADRTRVIQQLPALLQRLRQGLVLTGVTGAPQDAQIKLLTDTLAEAFLSKTASIAQEHIDAMARRLANLEDFISEDMLGDMPLSADNIELLLGIDASAIHVIADNGVPVPEDVLAWAQRLPLGVWFTVDHNGASAHVQYVWHSRRKQLHLFAAMDGSSYLLQLKRLGAYLQAGLLVAQEEESLTLRATRDALTKLDANPERLFE
ncbi:DUF1631 family protein [Alicycliphilus denitrificans]|uniref:DUF1631 family protein n=1 Tax=Alicycliphilus denitrificans TaxID=179636 RepID=UPI00384D88B8